MLIGREPILISVFKILALLVSTSGYIKYLLFSDDPEGSTHSTLFGCMTVNNTSQLIMFLHKEQWSNVWNLFSLVFVFLQQSLRERFATYRLYRWKLIQCRRGGCLSFRTEFAWQSVLAGNGFPGNSGLTMDLPFFKYFHPANLFLQMLNLILYLLWKWKLLGF